MKIKKDFIARKVAGEYIVVAVGKTSVSFHSMIRLNETSYLLWQKLEQGADVAALVTALTDKYEVDEATAAADVKAFVEQLREFGCMEEEA